eukprot:m.10839 g.10839  ORF g.10839 m.10839 type:complete len:492 (+) comp3733_c0_seq1:76-1551(+)
MDPLTVSLLCVIGVLLLLVHLKQLRERPRNVKSAPGELPILGHSFLVLNAQNRLLEWLYGGTIWSGEKPWYFKILGERLFVCISSPQSVQHILKDNFDNYVKGDFFIGRFNTVLGDGIFDVDGAEWTYQRKTASHIFKGNELRGFMSDVFVSHCHHAVDAIESYVESGKKFDLQDIFSRYTLESIGQIGYGIHLGCFENKVDFDFMEHFDAAQRVLMDRVLDPTWNVRRYLKFLYPGERELARHVKCLDAFARDVIKKRRAEEDLRDREDLLSRFMALKDENGEALDDTRLRDVIMNFVIAGRDTTANCLTWAFYELSQNPLVLKQLVEEIDRVVGQDAVTFSHVNDQLPFTHNVIKETLRLHPSVPKDVKTAVKDDILPDGTDIPAGTHVVYMPWVMGRLKSNYDDPMLFNPDRWNTITKTHYEFTAFNAGPRLCLGMNMAYLEAKFLMVNILQRFKVTPEEGQSYRYQVALAMPMKEGFFVTAQHRDDI